jgi:hypothetical protein
MVHLAGSERAVRVRGDRRGCARRLVGATKPPG